RRAAAPGGGAGVADRPDRTGAPGGVSTPEAGVNGAAHAPVEREPVDTLIPAEHGVPAVAELNAPERGPPGDLFAIVEEHASDSVVEIDRARVEEAFIFACEHHADQRRKSGEEFITHPAAVAKICAGLRLDTETLCAALLHDTVEDTTASLD